jgi:PAS domain S-box-containing protein
MSERLRQVNPNATAVELRTENAFLRQRVAELEETLEVLTAIRTGQVDAVIVDGDSDRPEVRTLESADRIHLRLAQQAANAGTWEWDITNRRVRGSESLWALLGVSPPPEHLSEDYWPRLVAPEDQERVQKQFQRALKSDEEFYEELRIVRPDQESRWIAVRGRVIRDSASRAQRVIGISLDITERKASEDALRLADRRKDEFLAMLAHELRNPLAAISNAFRLFRGVSLSESERDWTGEVLERQILQLQSLIDDLLDISRITQGKVELRRRTLELNELLTRVTETIRPRFSAAQQQFSVDLSSEPLWLWGDESRLEQVFVNLLTNAGKYTRKGGNVSLMTCRDADQVVITVKDTGIGIAPEMLPRVFDLFAQAERGLERTEGGLGIGLSLVRRIVELHDGSVSAHSEGSGRGSEFTVRLPVCEPQGRTMTTETPTIETSIKSRRVLIVDDNRDAAQTMALLIKLSGHETSTAHDGPEALAMLDEVSPEVALLDIGLPEMDGYELARRIRERMNDVYLIAVSGYGLPEDRSRSAAAGFNEHFVKPVDSAQLLASLSQRR